MSNLQAIIKFIHLGQIEVNESDLYGLIKTAKDLQIEELMGDTMMDDIEVGENNDEHQFGIADPDNELTSVNMDGLSTEAIEQTSEECIEEVKAKEVTGKTETSKFKCQHCDYQTNHCSHLKQHVSSIHEKTKNPCSECGKVFATRSGLGEHVRGTHGGLRFQCDECDKVFAYSSGIRMHKKSVHAGLRYPCDGCNYKASTPGCLKKHIYAKQLN